MSNGRRLRRPAKRAAARAVAAASVCGDCGARGFRPRKERGSGWVVDVPHDPGCPALRLPQLWDSSGAAAAAAAQDRTGTPLAYLPGGGGVVIARGE